MTTKTAVAAAFAAGPDDPCKRCGHERKWHNPCSVCFGIVSKNPKSTPQSRCKGFAEKVGTGNG